MLNLRFSTKIIIATAFICFILFLVFVSVLGINNRAKSDVQRFFQQISSRNYEGVRQFYSERQQTRQTSFQETMKFHFALELALLEYFGLMDVPRYSLKIKRDNMWLPVLRPNELSISINMTPQKDTNLITDYMSKPGDEALKGFITMTRENQKWKISSINIEGSKLENIFNKILPRLSAGKYVNATLEEIELRPAQLKVQHLDPLERKILTRDLRAALEILEKEKENHESKTKLPF